MPEVSEWRPTWEGVSQGIALLRIPEQIILDLIARVLARDLPRLEE